MTYACTCGGTKRNGNQIICHFYSAGTVEVTVTLWVMYVMYVLFITDLCNDIMSVQQMDRLLFTNEYECSERVKVLS